MVRGALPLSLFTTLACGASANAKIFGHKAPDTDAVSSAIIYAWELNERKIPATAYRLGELNPETEFVLDKLAVPSPPLLTELVPGEPVGIVDTNNPAELLDKITDVKIHSIVDHHKLSGLVHGEPLEIDMRPVCSATSILYSRAKAAGLTVSKQIAGLMLAGILSDSLEFRSPTTTELDKTHAFELGNITGLDVHEFAVGMLDAKSKVDHLSPQELIMMDSKVVKMGGKSFRISVLETTNAAAPLARQAALVDAMKAIKAKEKLDDVLLFVVDILNEAATFVSSSPSATAIVEKAWHVKVGEDGRAHLPGVLSRKKQIIPKLQSAASSSEL